MSDRSKAIPERKPRFSTISDMPIEPVYGPDALGPEAVARVGEPGPAPIHPGHPPDRLSVAPVDDAHVRRLRCGRGHQRALPPAPGRRPDRPVHRLRHAHPVRLRHGRPGGGRGVRHVRRGGQLAGRHGGPPARAAPRPGQHVDDHQLAGRPDLGDVPRGRREGGRPPRSAGGHDPERHPQGVHRPEGVPVPARAVDAPGHRHHRVRDPRDAALEHDLDQRLPHPRGRLDRGPGAGLHHRRRDGLRRGGPRARPARRRLRPAAELLLQLAQRLLRGDRQVPGQPAHLARPDDEALPRRERAQRLDALPHPDRRRVADLPAAAQQPDPRGPPGAGRRARRHPVAAHRRLRRGARRTDRRGRPAGPPPAAGHRRGDRASTPRSTRSAARGSSRP